MKVQILIGQSAASKISQEHTFSLDKNIHVVLSKTLKWSDLKCISWAGHLKYDLSIQVQVSMETVCISNSFSLHKMS